MLLSLREGQELQPDSLAELVGLYFCNRWHRPGGKYAVESSARESVLSLLPKHNHGTRLYTQGHSPISAAGNVERPTVVRTQVDPTEQTLALSSLHSSEQNTAPQPPRQAAPSPVGTANQEGTHVDTQTPPIEGPSQRSLGSTPEAPALVLRRTGLAVRRSTRLQNRQNVSSQTMMARRQPILSQGEDSSARTLPVRRSARLQAQQPAVPVQTSTSQSQHAQPQREEARTASLLAREVARLMPMQRGDPVQTQASELSRLRARESQLPAQRFGVSARHADSRAGRFVDINDDCAICQDTLGRAGQVARCNYCCNDFHTECALRWFSNCNTTPHCGFWYVKHSLKRSELC